MKRSSISLVAAIIGLFALQTAQAQKSKVQQPESTNGPQICAGCDPSPECNPRLNPIDVARFFVAQHYRDFLLREPDQGGLDFWTSQITQCGSNAQCLADRRVLVSRAFWESAEFRQQPRTSALDNIDPPPQYDNSEFVRLCFNVYLQREPDQGGFDFWRNILDDCAFDPGKNGNNGYQCYNDIIRAFLNSTEYRTRFGCS